MSVHMNAESKITCGVRSAYAIVLDDHPLIGLGIGQYMHALRPELPVRVTTEWAQAKQWIKMSGCPSLLVADSSLIGCSSPAVFSDWRHQCRAMPWLCIGDGNEPLLMQHSRNAGAQGFIYKRASPEMFSRAFAALLSGKEWFELSAEASEQRPRERTISPTELGLTLRQGDVLALILHGLSNKRIALLLSLSESTVKEHVSGILQRLGVSSRVGAITLLRARSLTLVCRQHDDIMTTR